MCLLLWAVGWGSVLETGSHLRGVPHAWGRKRSRVSQHTSCELSPGRLPPRTKAVLQPASSRAMARHGWSQAWGAALPRALARLLRCCPSPPAQQPPPPAPEGRPQGRAAQGRGDAARLLAPGAAQFWSHLCPPTCSRCSPRSSTALPETHGHQEEEENKAGRGHGPPHSHHASTSAAAATVSVAQSDACGTAQRHSQAL